MKCCMILRSLDRVFVFEFVKCLCIGAPSKDPARFVDLGFWIFEKQEEQEYKRVPKKQTTTPHFIFLIIGSSHKVAFLQNQHWREINWFIAHAIQALSECLHQVV